MESCKSAKTVLCLGPSGSGKTLLLKKLSNLNSVDRTTASVTTVGTNILTVNADGYQIFIRELGGIMAPLWSKYFAGVDKVIYVVDASNLCQISAAGVLLYSILADPQLKNSEVKKNLAFQFKDNLVLVSISSFYWF